MSQVFPGCEVALIDLMLDENKGFNKEIIPHIDSLAWLVRVSPSQSEKLINIVLNNSHEFSRLIKNNDDLAVARENFPEYSSIFSAHSVEEAKEARIKYCQIQAVRENSESDIYFHERPSATLFSSRSVNPTQTVNATADSPSSITARFKQLLNKF